MMQHPTHTNLLIDEEPLQVLPSLAVLLGLNEALILQQIHYWIHPKRNSGRVVDGKRWIFNSYKQWQEQFPFFTEKVIGNAIRQLEKRGVLLSRQDLNAAGSDRRKWYTVDYEALQNIQKTRMDIDSPDPDDGSPSRDHDDAQMGRSSITENTTETTTEKPGPPGPAAKPHLAPAQNRKSETETETPFDLFVAWCETVGLNAADFGAKEKGKQLAIAKRLLADGMTADDVTRVTQWLQSQTWREGGIDLFDIERARTKWRAAGSPKRAQANQQPDQTAAERDRTIDPEIWLGKYADTLMARGQFVDGRET